MTGSPGKPEREEQGNELTRREVLRGAAAGGMALGMGGALAATASAATAPPKTKSGGTLNVGIASGDPSDTLHVWKPFLYSDTSRIAQLYEPLQVRDNNWHVQMLLAKSIEPEGKTPDSWIIKLRPGITFHNGKPLTADDVIFSIKGMLSTAGAPAAKTLSYIDTTGLKKLDNLTVRVPLQKPVITFPDDIGGLHCGIVPAGSVYAPTNPPPGTGPFMFKSFDPGHQSTFVRNPHYWQGKVKLEEVVILDFPDDTARINALLGGSVDTISTVPYTQLGQIQGRKDLKLLRAPTSAFNAIAFNLQQPPFNDLRVRQAMRLLVNRPQMIKQVLNGHGRIGNDVSSIDDPVYDHKLPQRHQDIEKAKSLLKKAGQTGLKAQITTSTALGQANAAIVFSQQAQAAGVNITVNQVDLNTLYGANYLRWPGYIASWPGELYMSFVPGDLLSNAPYNSTQWHVPKYDSLFAQAEREVNAAKRTALLHEMQKMEYQYGGNMIWGFMDSFDAYSAKLTGFQPDKTGTILHEFWQVAFLA